jgi:thiol:disulfide interchange protein DsbD
MEDYVWPQKEVFDKIANDYVLVSLYVDDKESLDDTEQYISAKTGKKIKTIGNKWNDLQITYFNMASQPYYVLMSPDGKVLNQPVAYTPDEDEYANFLQCGLDAYKELNEVAKK